jgi:hypothetical protein
LERGFRGEVNTWLARLRLCSILWSHPSALETSDRERGLGR